MFKFFFAWYDFWVGAYYDRDDRSLYVCPLPCCVFKFQFSKPVPKPEVPEPPKTDTPTNYEKRQKALFALLKQKFKVWSRKFQHYHFGVEHLLPEELKRDHEKGLRPEELYFDDDYHIKEEDRNTNDYRRYEIIRPLDVYNDLCSEHMGEEENKYARERDVYSVDKQRKLPSFRS